MVFDDKELLEIAYVIKAHGLKGHLSLKIFEDFSDIILKENMPVFLNVEGIPVPFFIENIKNAGNNFIVKLKHIDSGDTATRFKSCPVLIFTDDYAEQTEDEYVTGSEISGYEVFDSVHGYIGKVKDLNMIPGNPVFETDFNGKTIIIPYIDEFIENIDHENKRIDIATPEGLIELYL